MSERNPKRFENGSSAQQRSAEEQRRLTEEYDQARYEEAFPVDEDSEKAYNDAMAARAESAAEGERDSYAAIEGRIMERQENDEGEMVLVHPELNRMYMMAQQIAELKASNGEPQIISDKENKLQELLEAYSDQAQTNRDLEVRNAEINERSTVKGREIRSSQEAAAEEELARRMEEVDFIINSTDEAWVNEKLGTNKEAAPEKDADKEKDLIKDPEEARILADVEEITRIIRSDPEAAKKSGAFDKVRELMAQIDAALASAKASEELKEPKDGELSGDDEELKEPKDGELTDEEIKTPKDGELLDDEEIKEPKDGALDGEGDEEIKTPKDGELTDDTDEERPRRRGILGLWDRLGLAYATRGGTPVGVLAHGAERLRSSNKGKVAAVIGGLAVVGALIAGRHYGWFDGGHGGGSSSADPKDLTPGQKGGHPGGDGHIDTPPPTPKATPEIPSGDAYAHPWNWMTAAIENGSITPPKGMGAEQALHHYGELAEAAGHKVEWYNLPNGLEAVRIDGSDDTEMVADVLTQFAK
jgi:hypothetical protein